MKVLDARCWENRQHLAPRIRLAGVREALRSLARGQKCDNGPSAMPHLSCVRRSRASVTSLADASTFSPSIRS